MTDNPAKIRGCPPDLEKHKRNQSSVIIIIRQQKQKVLLHFLFSYLSRINAIQISHAPMEGYSMATILTHNTLNKPIKKTIFLNISHLHQIKDIGSSSYVTTATWTLSNQQDLASQMATRFVIHLENHNHKIIVQLSYIHFNIQTFM